MCIGLHVKYPLFLSGLIESVIFSTNSLKYTQTSNGSRIVPCETTDGQTHIIVAFRGILNAHINEACDVPGCTSLSYWILSDYKTHDCGQNMQYSGKQRVCVLKCSRCEAFSFPFVVQTSFIARETRECCPTGFPDGADLPKLTIALSPQDDKDSQKRETSSTNLHWSSPSHPFGRSQDASSLPDFLLEL